MADTDYSQTIIGYYKNILGRVPGADEVAVWNNRLQSGATTISGLAQTFATSPEAKEFSQPVAELYQSLLGRSPDQAGLEHWTAQYKSAVTGGEDSHAALASIAQQFFQSPETQALYGSDGSTAADVTASAVTKLYENALGREPGKLANGTSEVQYWVDKAQTQNLSLQNVATQFALSPEATSGDQQARVVANLIAGATGIELTSGADSLQGTASNDLFVAGTFQDGPNLVSTLGQNDTLTGNGGSDTLLVRGLMNHKVDQKVGQKVVGNDLGAPTLNNIQNLDIQGSTGLATLDLQNAQGTTNVSLDSDKGLTLNLNDAKNVQNLSVGSSDGATVHVADSAKTLNVALNNTSTTAQNFTLGTDKTQNVNITATGSENLTLEGNGPLEGNGHGSQVQNVTVSGSNASDAFTLTGTNAGSLKDLTSVDASNFAGSSKINVDALIKDYGAAHLATVTAGSGSSDEVMTSASNLASATNTTGVNVSGFEKLGALGGKYDLKALNAAGNSISKVDVSQATNTVELDNAQSGLTVASTSVAAHPHDLAVKNVYATTGNTLNLQVGDGNTLKNLPVGDNATANADHPTKMDASIGNVIFDQGTSTVNIVSDLDQAGDAAVGANGKPAYTNIISDLNAKNGGVSSIDVSGAGNLDVTKLEAGKSALTVDASKATGQVNFDDITGSTKGDTFTAGSGGSNVIYNSNVDSPDPTKVTNTFTGGAGQDKFTIEDTPTDNANYVLTGGAGVDTFNVTGLQGTAATATFNYSSASDALLSVDANGKETDIETIKGFQTVDPNSNTVKDKIDLSALGLNVSGGIGFVDVKDTGTDAITFGDILNHTASATELSSLKDLFASNSNYIQPVDSGTSPPSGNFAATLVSMDKGTDALLFVNNAGSTDFDASKDSVIALKNVHGSIPTQQHSTDWAQALVLSK